MTDVGAKAAATDPTRIAILEEKTRRRLRTSTFEARPIARAITIPQTGITTLASQTKPVIQAVHVRQADVRLSAEAGVAVADLATGTLTIVLTRLHTHLICGADSTCITVVINDARVPFDTLAILGAGPGSWTIDVGLTGLITATTRANSVRETVQISSTYLRFLTGASGEIASLIAETAGVLTPGQAEARVTHFVRLAILVIETAPETATVSVVRAFEPIFAVIIGTTGRLTLTKLTDSQTDAVQVA